MVARVGKTEIEHRLQFNSETEEDHFQSLYAAHGLIRLEAAIGIAVDDFVFFQIFDRFEILVIRVDIRKD